MRTWGRAVAPGDPAYPAGLLDLPERPVVYLQGPWDDVERCVAIVGSRRADPDGLDLASTIAADLARSGIPVLSGLARGIDAAAHRGALSAGGRSGAVLGTPLDSCHPRRHRELQDELARSLGILTELPPGASAARSTFASRNRLLAALARVVVVVQGTAGSGSLITAREARRLGRTVAAVPWDVWTELGAAPLELLRSGASLVRSAGDVIALLPQRARPLVSLVPAPAPAPERHTGADLPPRERAVWNELRREARTAEELAGLAGLPIAQVGAALVALELRGLASREPGGRFRRARRLPPG